MRQKLSILSITTLLLMPVLGCFGQQDQAHILSVFDRLAGYENSGIFNGVQYNEQHRTVNDKHKFFISRDFITGDLQYDGQFFPDTEMKYNIYDGLVLVRAKQQKGATVLQLINEKVEKFVLEDHVFVNLKDVQAKEQGLAGFYEQLLKNETLGLYKKYTQQINSRRDKNMVYYEFEDEKNDHVLYLDGSYNKIGSRRDVRRLFPELKDEIRNFYRSNRSLRRSSEDRFMVLLFEEITSLLSEKNLAVQ